MRKVGFLGQVSSDQPNGIFNRSPLPTAIGIAEVGSGAQDPIDLLMVNVLRAVVVGDGSSHMRGMPRQTAGKCLAQRHRCFPGQFGKVEISARALQEDPKSILALPGNRRVSFPMAWLFTSCDVTGTLINGHTVWNMALPVPPTVPSTLPFLMRSNQIRYQIQMFAYLGIVDVLVDGFVANTKIRMVHPDSPSNQLR